MNRNFLYFLLLADILISCASGQKTAALSAPEKLPEFNQIVLDVLKKYPKDGTHDYWWPRGGEGSYDGGTKDIYFEKKQVMKGKPKKRTYCCGFTLEIFLDAYKVWLKDHGGEKASVVIPDHWARFKKLWFVQKLNGPGPSAALEEYGLGRTIEPDEALAGDFVQIWRTIKEGKKSPSGHSVIFLDWVKNDAGKISGFKYISSQPGTDGIGERVEYFGPNGGINAIYTFFGRVEPKARKPKPEPKPKPKKKQTKPRKPRKQEAK